MNEMRLGPVSVVSISSQPIWTAVIPSVLALNRCGWFQSTVAHLVTGHSKKPEHINPIPGGIYSTPHPLPVPLSLRLYHCLHNHSLVCHYFFTLLYMAVVLITVEPFVIVYL